MGEYYRSSTEAEEAQAAQLLQNVFRVVMIGTVLFCTAGLSVFFVG